MMHYKMVATGISEILKVSYFGLNVYGHKILHFMHFQRVEDSQFNIFKLKIAVNFKMGAKY